MVIVNDHLLDGNSLAEALSNNAERKVRFLVNPKGTRGRYLILANTNALSAITTKHSSKLTIYQRFSE
jgi:excinuclease ABC subunit C